MLDWRGVLLCVCLIQLWTITPGFADKGCSSFGHLENGRTFFRYGGLYVTFTCNSGFRIHGYRTSSCVSGQWVRNPPLCVGSGCPSLGDLLNGSSVMSQDRSLAFFRCDAGYRLFGSALLYCKGKIWNGTKPVCKEADIMTVSAQGLEEVTSPKEAFLRSTLIIKPHITRDKQESIKKTIEKKLRTDKTLTPNKGVIDNLKEPISSLENVKDQVSNVDRQRSLLVASFNVTTIISHLTGSSLLNTVTTSTSFTTPLMDMQQVKGSTTNIMDQTVPSTSYTFGPDKPSQRIPDASAVETVPAYDPHWTTSAPNINTQSTDKTQPMTFILKTSYEANTKSSRPSQSPFLKNVTSLTSADYHQENKRNDQNEPKHTLHSPAWKDREIPSFPIRRHRPVCSYPPVPSHGTFYFRSIKNPGPLHYKHYIQYACYPGYTLISGDVYSYCQHNGQWSGKTPLCLALTPCSLNNGGCSQICQDDGQNRSQCFCKAGFLLLEDQRTCRDLDECVEQLHMCQQVCENTPGSYRCRCSAGFQLSTDRTSCTNISECEEIQQDQLNRCEWKCMNLSGTHRCICPRGYRLHPDGYQCEDINECEWRNGGCSHLCINHRGGYKCSCPETHQISSYNQKNCQLVHTQINSSQ